MTTYTAVATATGEGRNGGHTVTDDGLLDVTLAVPKELGAGAHQICPYSKATRGNVEVTIDATVDR